MKTNHRAFTLVEILVVAFIVTLLAGILLPPAISGLLIRGRIQEEDATLAGFASDITKSFEARDLSTFNIAALPGEIDAATQPTVFTTSTAPTYSAITGYEWIAKIARARGFTVVNGQPISKTSQPALYNIAFNTMDRPRYLLVAPAEDDKQRYILFSVIGRDDELIVPPYQNTKAWFDAIWDTPWERFDAQLPAAWTSVLTAAQVSVWNGDTSGKSRLNRLRRVNITQRRHEIVVNSNHPTDSVWVRWNNDSRQYTLAPATGAWHSPLPLPLAGRIFVIYTGLDFASAVPTENTVRERNIFQSQ